jgi:hypothetical protein
MRLPIVAVLLSLFALSLHADAPRNFGDPFPLTDTRYGTRGGTPRLVASDDRLFLAWSTPGEIRLTDLTDGTPDLGRVILTTDGDAGDDFSIVWTGSGFLLAVSGRTGTTPTVSVLRLDAAGQPLGALTAIVQRGSSPRLAVSGSRALLVFRSTSSEELRALPLALDGTPLATRSELVDERGTGDQRFEVTAAAGGFAVIAASSGRVTFASFDANGAPLVRQTLAGTTPLKKPRGAAIAGNSAGSMLVWTDDDATGFAAAASAGSAAAPVAVAFAPAGGALRAPSVAWNGTDWDAVFLEGTTGSAVLRNVRLAGSGAGISTATIGGATTAGETEALFAHGRVTAAYPVADAIAGTPIAIARLPLGFGSGIATLGAADQEILDVTWTKPEAVIVFAEERDSGRALRAFVGDASFHREFAVPFLEPDGVRAASDGKGYLLTGREGKLGVALTMTSNGVFAALPALQDFVATDLTYGGNRYATAGIDENGAVKAALLDKTGKRVSSAVVENISNGVELSSPLIASDGSGYLVVWTVRDQCSKSPCATGLAGARLNGLGVRVDASDLEIAPQGTAGAADLVWDGEKYLAVWTDGEKVLARAIPSAGSIAPTTIELYEGDAPQSEARVARIGNDVIVGWSDGARPRIAWLDAESETDESFALAVDFFAAGGAWPLAIGYDKPAALMVLGKPTAPHYGAQRIALEIPNGGPFLPAAPIVTARREGDAIRVEWTVPAGPLNGFRLEVRHGDGEWRELDAWYTPVETSASWQPPAHGEWSFRVRAFRDAGAGGWSSPASVRFTKLRAAR